MRNISLIFSYPCTRQNFYVPYVKLTCIVYMSCVSGTLKTSQKKKKFMTDSWTLEVDIKQIEPRLVYKHGNKLYMSSTNKLIFC